MPAAQHRNTRQRRLVLDAVRELGCHPTAGEVYAHVHEVDPKVSLGTVYRNLNLLAEQGSILAVRTPGECRYDHRTDGHDHVVCVRCGAVADADVPRDDSLEARAAALTGFRVGSHYTVFEGLCPACQESGENP